MKEMKKIHKKLFAIGLLALFLFAGCTKDFEEMNISPNDPPEVPTAYLLTSAEKGPGRIPLGRTVGRQVRKPLFSVLDSDFIYG
ncbi:MAG: hypothetical protein U5Q03_09785 [Bacteroidota bacterium]|nr:hypothetical protein [Bacteroidota bacterium]